MSWIRERLADGDVLLTYGSAGFWPPRRWILGLVYHAIRKFQERRWGRRADCGATHVRTWVNGEFFEATVPVCRWATFESLQTSEKRWKLCRYNGPLDSAALKREAQSLIGTPYDKGDLLDFALSGWLGRASRVITLFGDRANKYRVCSTAAAQVLSAAGARFDLPPAQIDPAYFANKPDQWRVVANS